MLCGNHHRIPKSVFKIEKLGNLLHKLAVERFLAGLEEVKATFKKNIQDMVPLAPASSFKISEPDSSITTPRNSYNKILNSTPNTNQIPQQCPECSASGVPSPHQQRRSQQQSKKWT
jgi:hypothetical protein